MFLLPRGEKLLLAFEFCARRQASDLFLPSSSYLLACFGPALQRRAEARPLCLTRALSTTLLRPWVDLPPASGVGGEVPRNVVVDRRHRDTARPTVAVGSQLASA